MHIDEICFIVYFYLPIEYKYIYVYISSGDFNYTFCSLICVLFVVLCDSLMTVAEATETCW